MEGSTVDHSDSDSGESWTLLDHSEHTPAYADEAPIFQQNDIDHERIALVQNNEKDEDTDGISIISDSEPESTPCEISYDRSLLADEIPVQHHTQYIDPNSLPHNTHEQNEPLRSEDFLGDSHGKHKTYVHRRNKRLSTVLNIIMLGSVITAAGVAIGHMWGARNDCTMHTTPTVHKILSNLYKLQEENAYLRNKLKELTLLTNTQFKKSGVDKLPVKQPRCRKVYEESLDKRNADKITKCVDIDNKAYPESMLESHFVQPEYEKEFLNDIDKLKHVYQQNKSWLDDEIAKRIKNEKEKIKKIKTTMKGLNLSPVDEEVVELNSDNEKNVEPQTFGTTFGNVKNIEQDNHVINEEGEEKLHKLPKARKITYAESLKSAENVRKHQKRNINDNFRSDNLRRKGGKHNDIPEVIQSEEDFIKDDRYIGPKMKQERKKYDHQKIHKKQKRKNKYEQWEMKGGIMKDYDAISTKSQESENILKYPDQYSTHFEKESYTDQFVGNDNVPNIEIIDANPSKHSSVDIKNVKKTKDGNWFDKRTFMRAEARRKLELELFGESNPSNGGWYFRRMQRREQCRAKGDNSTYRKLSKRNMNFKMKH